MVNYRTHLSLSLFKCLSESLRDFFFKFSSNASVKEDLDEKTFAELSEEGKGLSFEELGGFENKVKAFAYEATKKNKDNNEEDDVVRFASSNNENVETDNDVFNRISKM